MDSPVSFSKLAAEVSTSGDLVLDQKDFDCIAGIVRSTTGISLSTSKRKMVQARLGKHLRTLGYESFSQYCYVLKQSSGVHERQLLIAAITTNVTKFFREQHHFDALRTRVLPPLIERAKRGERLRLWSAGCSTGEEPYSMAMTVLELMPDAAEFDVKILASDLDLNALDVARMGVYTHAALQNVPRHLRHSCFEPRRNAGGVDYAVTHRLRRLVSFKQLNLTWSLPMRGNFDVIFCRNVVIYFDHATKLAVWRALAERLETGSWMFIGHSERIDTALLPMFSAEGITSYRRVQGRERRVAED